MIFPLKAHCFCPQNLFMTSEIIQLGVEHTNGKVESQKRRLTKLEQRELYLKYSNNDMYEEILNDDDFPDIPRIERLDRVNSMLVRRIADKSSSLKGLVPAGFITEIYADDKPQHEIGVQELARLQDDYHRLIVKPFQEERERHLEDSTSNIDLPNSGNTVSPS